LTLLVDQAVAPPAVARDLADDEDHTNQLGGDAARGVGYRDRRCAHGSPSSAESRIDTLIRLAGAMAVRPEELLDGIAWIPAPETEGTFTSRPPRYRFRRPDS